MAPTPACQELRRFLCPQGVHQECFELEFDPLGQQEANRERGVVGEEAFLCLAWHVRVRTFTLKCRIRVIKPGAYVLCVARDHP